MSFQEMGGVKACVNLSRTERRPTPSQILRSTGIMPKMPDYKILLFSSDFPFSLNREQLV